MPASTLVACARIAAAQPAISSVVSARALLVDKAARKAAFCVVVVSPLMISFITALSIVGAFLIDLVNALVITYMGTL